MTRKNQYDKSPLNYIGGKYKILPQILKFFPKRINNFVDIFCGGLDVATNIKANKVFCNDINYHVIDIYKEFQKLTIEELLTYIDNTIAQYELSQTNQEAFLAFRNHYNETRNPLDLYVLVCYSFNYQFRFNSHHEFNCPFGKDRSSFNPVMRENLIKFHHNISPFIFSTENFKKFDYSFLKEGDMLYADPPYRITTGSYNDGKRGFEGWSIEDDLALFSILDMLNEKGVKFALSNVLEHKGKKNFELIEWKKKYHTHTINFNYNNSNYHSTARKNKTVEVLITNY